MNKTWIVISLAVALVIAFTAGITIFRQTRAIWTMTSTNAVTINATLNTFTGLEPMMIIIAVVGLAFLLLGVNRGFGRS